MDLHLTPGVEQLSNTHPIILPQTDATPPAVTETRNTTLKSLSADRLEALPQMQKTDPFANIF